MLIWIRNIVFPRKLADLQFGDWGTKEICEFAICGLIITFLQICNLQTSTPQEFADVRLQNEPKNLRICDMRTNRKNLRAHLWWESVPGDWRSALHGIPLHLYFVYGSDSQECKKANSKKNTSPTRKLLVLFSFSYWEDTTFLVTKQLLFQLKRDKSSLFVSGQSFPWLKGRCAEGILPPWRPFCLLPPCERSSSASFCCLRAEAGRSRWRKRGAHGAEFSAPSWSWKS